MTYPQWLNPAPRVLEFVGSFSNIEPREPFANMRKATQNDPLPSARSFAKADQIRGSMRGGLRMRTKAQEDAHNRGETMEMRKRRQSREAYARNPGKARERYLRRKALKAAQV